MLKQTERYICTTVSLSEEDKKNLPAMDVESNTFLVTKIFNDIDSDPLFKPKEKMVSYQIKVQRDFQSEYQYIQNKCKEFGVPFSKVYLKYVKKYFS